MSVFARALPRLRIVLPAAALAAGLLTAASLGAAKPDPTLIGADATPRMVGAMCAVDVDVSWVDVKGPGSVTVELTGTGNQTSSIYDANSDGASVTLWPSDSGPWDQVDVVVTKKNGTELIAGSAAVSATCP